MDTTQTTEDSMTKPIYTYYSDAHGAQMQVVDIDDTGCAGSPRQHAVEMPADYDPSEVTDEDAHHDSQIRVIDDEVMRESGWDYDVTDDYERVWRRVERVLTVRWDDWGDSEGWCYELVTDGEVEDEGPIDDLDDARSLQQDITEWTAVRCYRIGDERDPEGGFGPVLASLLAREGTRSSKHANKRELEVLFANAENRHWRALMTFERVADDPDASEADCAAAYRGVLERRAQRREARAALASFLAQEGTRSSKHARGER